ncbi:butyrate kinase [Fusibacillus kribbianus]|uniref:Probable butyrate kinase n=1 Tax=Fusibacillus kribbianus TaxID=3044208 RepID=A0AAP4EXP7_9FIRM|nr:butyrate kinase [Ruminococcus sp. YH-rum2234]MDI9242754.1 butyrate kinase [Ruminococcus sp. YH-rum2234]
MNTYRILVINPGSTSTKLSMFENEKCLFTQDVFHDSSVLKEFLTINDQLPYRMEVVRSFLKDGAIDLHGVDAIVGRGGGCYSVTGGVYRIDDCLIEDTRMARGGLYHSSMLGVQMAAELNREYGGIMLMMDPPVVDELCDLARVTGVDGVYRTAVSHALNLKATARKHAASIGRRYEDCNFIVCHIDGGISVTAHQKGRMIDGNDAGGGEGPFTPTRMGSMAVTDVLRLLDSKTREEFKSLCSQTGGFGSYYGTSNSDYIHELVKAGDKKAVRIWRAMIYQVIKYIGSMSTVLKGEVDGILLTGGLLRFPDVEEQIKESCQWIAPVTAYPGEFEQEAMALGALRVLRGEEEARTYTGKPVWDGFEDDA